MGYQYSVNPSTKQMPVNVYEDSPLIDPVGNSSGISHGKVNQTEVTSKLTSTLLTDRHKIKIYPQT